MTLHSYDKSTFAERQKARHKLMNRDDDEILANTLGEKGVDHYLDSMGSKGGSDIVKSTNHGMKEHEQSHWDKGEKSNPDNHTK